MDRIFSRAARACIALALVVSASPAFAGQTLDHLLVIIKQGGKLVVQTETDKTGKLTATLAPGSYTIELSGPSLARALTAIDPKGGKAPRVVQFVASWLYQGYMVPILTKDIDALIGPGSKPVTFEFTTPAKAGAKPVAYTIQLSLAEPGQAGRGDARWNPVVPKPAATH
jgi:hypothetical protein